MKHTFVLIFSSIRFRILSKYISGQPVPCNKSGALN